MLAEHGSLPPTPQSTYFRNTGESLADEVKLTQTLKDEEFARGAENTHLWNDMCKDPRVDRT